MRTAKRPVWALMTVLTLGAWCDLSGAGVSLIDAIKSENRAAIRALIQQPDEVKKPEKDGATALHWAAYLDDLETAKLLIDAGADVNATNRHGVTPLSLACLNGTAAMIEMLLRAGADPNARLRDGETELMTAARTGKVDAVKMLLAYGADVNAQEAARGQTALMWAADENHAAVVQVLVAAGADIGARSNVGFTAFLFAVRDGHVDAVKTLIKAGADVNDTTMLFSVRLLRFSPTADERPVGPSALLLAIANSHFELASLLLDAGANPNAAAQGWTALHRITTVRKHARDAVIPEGRGSGGIDSLELVRRLVARGADVNFRAKKHMGSNLNTVGATPFLLAARGKDVELMGLLAELGADPLIPNADNTTPLLAAAGVGTGTPGGDPGNDSEGLEAVKLALMLGGDVNAVDNNGETAMHGAAYKHFPSVVRFLAENGAKIEVWNQKNKEGWTPLVIAEGVRRANNVHFDAETAAAIRKAMNYDAAPGTPLSAAPKSK